MWIYDLELAIVRVKEVMDCNNICFERITPCADGGIVFKTTHFTYIKWFPDGSAVEREEDEWRRTVRTVAAPL